MNNLNVNNDSKDIMEADIYPKEESFNDFNSYRLNSQIFYEDDEIEIAETKPLDILIVFIDDESSLLELYSNIMKRIGT